MHFWMLPLCWVLKEILQEMLNSHWKIKGQQQHSQRIHLKGSHGASRLQMESWCFGEPSNGMQWTLVVWSSHSTIIMFDPQYFPHNWSLIPLKGITPSYMLTLHQSQQVLNLRTLSASWRWSLAQLQPFKIQSCQDAPPQTAILSCPQLCSDREGKLTPEVICVPSFTWRCCIGHGLQSCYCAA